MSVRPLLQTPFRSYLNKQGADGIVQFMTLFLPGVDSWHDGFKGDLFKGGAAPGVYQSTASGTASAVAAIDTGVVNGQIILDPGTADAGRSDLSLGLHYRGDLNATCWWRINMRDAVTSSKFEVGFTDVISGTDAGAVNVKATPSFTATDAVVLCRDTNDDTNLTLLGVANGTAATAIDFTTVLAANTIYWLGVALQDGLARGFIYNTDGDELERTAWMSSAITSTVLLTPWAFVQNRSAAQRRMNIDTLFCYQWETVDTP